MKIMSSFGKQRSHPLTCSRFCSFLDARSFYVILRVLISVSANSKEVSVAGYPRKGQTIARHVSSIDVQNCGIASKPSQTRHPRCIVSKILFRERDLSFHAFRKFLNLLALKFEAL